MPSKYPDEFRRDVVRVARSSGVSASQVARDFGISQPCLSRWLREADAQEIGPDSGVSVAQFRAARERIRVLEQENEILRRAAAYFARDALPK